ncbi:saccharopine dehydrogenase family protein [Halococcoides cellulosivorans]|uniref:Oxidoreductase n=1 Tax=Halococcoides cellulosivorans TaxID=1679096 RepID=A0A2R4WZJ5_9EURY|nr:saccharopine dehydrogenase NADP-binding domain-containing protein [Halococcoides cellulosivorans]AWB26960.1 oxidoreductase [Halococcoides cellulosivorans]
MPDDDTQRDILVWGATGVAGEFVADVLTEQYAPPEISIALGGRDERRLQAIAAELANRHDWDAIPIVVGDATDRERLREVAAQTDVVCSTVGPYARLGTDLVAACVETGTDYCDLTGEIHWVREMIDRYHDAAVDAGARIVHSCGFDSVPADLGTLLVQSAAIERYDEPCETVRIFVESGSGTVSGGTAASIAAMFDAVASDPLARQTLANPYSLAPPGERAGVDPGASRRPHRDALRGAWTGPSPMADVNERVVRRSNALLDYPWGREFRVSERIPTGSGIGGAARASALAGGLGLFGTAMAVGPVRSALQRWVFPAPGEGPTRAETADGHFSIRVIGRGTAPDGPFTVAATIGAPWDPGYGATARMISECALCLVFDDIDSPFEGGVLTPASGIGLPLADRLRAVGFTMAVDDGREDRGE